MAKKKTIVICTSSAFYRHANEIAEQLRSIDYKVVVPETARRMGRSDDYDVTKVKTWVNNPDHFHKKNRLATNHFKEIEKGDAVLIINDDKPGRPRYIGPNTTMEWGLAYYLGKPIFILNGVPKNSNFYEEVYGMATVLDGDLGKIRL